MQKFQYTTVDTILAKFNRDFRGLDIGETDAIEWIGEALGHMKMASVSEEAVAFLEVSNYQCFLPDGLQYIIQIGRNNAWSKKDPACCNTDVIVQEIAHGNCEDCCGKDSGLVAVDCQGNLIGDPDIAYYRPYFDLQYEYLGWANNHYYRNNYSVVRLANNSFHNTLVCRTEEQGNLYQGGRDEYTIVQDQLRFNFKEGFIALAYLRTQVDEATGYPMIPDDESAKAAITYYLTWKVKEREAYSHREGALQLSQMAEQHWLKYIKQFKNKAKMPFGTDQYQNLMEQSKYLLPRQNRYYGFFGKLGTPEDKRYSDPNGTNRISYFSGNAGYL